MLHGGDVAQPQLVVFVPLDDHAFDLLHGPELVGDGHPDPVGTVVVIARIIGIVLSVERRQHLGRRDAERGHLLREHRNVDALLPFAVNRDAGHALQIADLAADELGVVREPAFGQSVARQSVEHAVDQSEVVLHLHRSALRQSRPRVADLAAQHVPRLLYVGVGNRAFQLHLDQRQIVVRPTGYVVHLADRADALFESVTSISTSCAEAPG